MLKSSFAGENLYESSSLTSLDDTMAGELEKNMPIKGPRQPLPPIDSLLAAFELSTLRSPDSIALVEVESGIELTFRQLSRRVSLLAKFLTNSLSQCPNNLNPDGDKVLAVCISPSIDLIICLFAILKVRGAYLPLDVNFPTARVNHILEDSKPQLLLVKGNPPAAAHLRTNVIDGVTLLELDEFLTQIDQEEDLPEEVSDVNNQRSGADNLASILYTSGSTGTPKGVRILQTAVLNRLVWQWNTFPYGQNEVCCFKTALTFVDSISEIFGPLLTGHRLVIIPKWMTKDPEKFVEVLERYKVCRLVLVPTLLRVILLHVSRVKGALPHLKLWICSGEVFPPDLLFKFFEHLRNNQSICNFYGSTEVLGDVTYVQFRNIEDLVDLMSNKKVPIGKPITNMDIYILDSNLEEIQNGSVGELMTAGLNLAKGYVGGAGSTNFIDNPHSSKPGFNILYRTGDFARFVGGNILYEGRTDSQLKVRGHRVDLSEIEAAVQGIRGIKKCHVVGHCPGEIEQAIIAFYTSSDEEITPEYIKDRVSNLLPAYMHPEFFRIEEMPLLVNGKVDRQRLLKEYEDKGFRASLQEPEFDLTGCEEGKKEMARVLVRAVTKVLGPSAPGKLSLDQNFFEVGGNSLNAIAAITAFHDSGYNIGISDFLKAESFLDILKYSTKMADNPFEQNEFFKDMLLEDTSSRKYKPLLFKEEFKDTIKRITTESFVKKGDLEILLSIKENEYNNYFEQIWDTLLTQQLSFVVCEEESEEIVAVAINWDFYDQPEIFFPSRNLKYIFEFLDECETKVRYYLPEGKGKVMHSVLMATRDDMSTSENVILIQVMEEENFQIAKKNNFEAIFTTNTSNITQHVCEDIFSYKVLATYQVNKWTAEDGNSPFKHAQEYQTAVCSVFFIADEGCTAQTKDP